MEKAAPMNDEEEVELLQVPNMMNNHIIGSTSSSFQFQDHPNYSSSSPPKPSSLFTKLTTLPPQNTVVTTTRYKECLKNHAAAMGMTATDGCGEFMPGSSPESALICSACGCHRNFHRQETVIPSQPYYPNPKPSCTCHHHNNGNAAKIIINNNEANNNNNNRNYPNLGHTQEKLVNLGPPGFDHMDRAQPKINTHDQIMGARPGKRSRTKLSREQKERMARFADKIGWRLLKQDVELLQEFCQEIGVRTSVFKVWMHNNKHTTRVGDRKNVQ